MGKRKINTDLINETAKEPKAEKLIVTKDEIGNNKIPLWLFLLTKPKDWTRHSKFT